MHHRCVATVLATCVSIGAATGADRADETFGCQGNPTGNPIGGGEGYRGVLSGGDHVVTTASALLDALKKARPGQVIWVPGEGEIDLTGKQGVSIPGGVTLASNRGVDGSVGGRIFTKQLATFPLFATGGENVRLTGLRFEGPCESRDRIAESSGFVTTGHYGLEVDNCEIYHWNIFGVGGRRGASKLRVHHCYIHHCQRSGYGYGVSLSECDACVIANKFDWCRHHIAASGSPGCAYEAAYNLILPNANGHYFDMHGGRDRGDGTDVAGDWMLIHHNTFQGAQRAIVIRGVPAQEAEVHHNWFARPAKQTVVSGGNTRMYRNVWGPDKTLEE
ncbi:MAG: right-handed parallel beta-helix repeat-containing protein [Phycisphaerae bacterium]|nr:right-handed parallel beta-helix repeat-containing protein [Phycisphaerae bacterium]